MPDLFEGSISDQNYNAQQIEVLEGLEPVRHRPGMFIGGTDDRAMHHLVAEILDNSMDEAVAGHATWIEINLIDGFTIKNASDMSMFLLEKAQVATVTGNAFGNPNCIRISYAASKDKITEAIERIKKYLN